MENTASIFFASGNMLSFEWRLIYTCIATFIVNIPFGYLRGGVKKFSFWWFLAIHFPVPVVIMIREFHGLELSWTLAPFLTGSYFLGQYIGKRLHNNYSCFFCPSQDTKR